MFREIILPIFKSTRLCVTVCGIMHARCCRPPAGNIVRAYYKSIIFHEYIGAAGGDGGDDNDDDDDIDAHSCKIPIELWKKSSWWDLKPRTKYLE